MENPDIETPALTADRPIITAEEDLFNRQTYVHSLADALCHADAEHGLVVGINGPWGSGKTSLKNLLIEEMITTQSQGSEAHFIEFEPWMFSGSGRPVSLMFSQIAQDLHPKVEQAKRRATKAVSAVTRHESAIIATSEYIPVPGAATITKATLKAFNGMSEALNPGNHDIDKLAQRREKLKKNLSKSDSRIIVFIDDLDRLMDDEVIDMLRAVKAVGDLPNMTYVLLYDRDALTESLDKTCHGKGDEFLEKIIQVPIGMPEPPRDIIQKIIREKISSLPGIQNNEYYLYTKAYAACVQPFLKTPRDANRFYNEFRLRYTTMRDDVEVADLLAITSLHVFRPDLHRWIFNHKNLLCNPVASRVYFQGREDLERHRAQQLKNALTEFDQENQNMLSSLFPFVEAALQDDWSRASVRGDEPERPLSSKEHFDSYFRLSLDEGILHESQYKQFLLTDPLDDSELDDEHLTVFNDRFFPEKAATYLGIENTNRLTLVINYCLKCDQKQSFNDGTTIHVISAIINESSRTGDQISLASALIDTIVKSDSPTAMLCAVFLAYRIDSELRPNNNSTRLFDDYPLLRIPLHRQQPSDWETMLTTLKTRLMNRTDVYEQMMVIPYLLTDCLKAITLLFDQDDERITALQTFGSKVDEHEFALYAASVLIEEYEDSYAVNLPILEHVVHPETFTTAVEHYINQGSFLDIAPANRTALAAYAVIIKKSDYNDQISKEDATAVIQDWIRRTQQAQETQNSQNK